MKARNHYESLGVSGSASSEDIRKAYRSLARKYHPDTNPGDPQAEERFKEIQRAYEILSDPRKRRAYDGPRPPRATNFPPRNPKKNRSRAEGPGKYGWEWSGEDVMRVLKSLGLDELRAEKMRDGITTRVNIRFGEGAFERRRAPDEKAPREEPPWGTLKKPPRPPKPPKW